MKKEIWDWLQYPKLCRNSGSRSIKNSLKPGLHERSSTAGFEKRRISPVTVRMNTNDASCFSPSGRWSHSRRMSGINVDETEAVSGEMETLVIGVLGQLGGLGQINGVDQETLADRPSFGVQEKSHDLRRPNHIIQSLHPSNHGRIKEIYCRFSFLADYLSFHRKHRHDAFNVFQSREKNVESELEFLSDSRSSVGGRIEKMFGSKIERSTSLHFEKSKLDKVKRVFFKKSDGTAKESRGFLIQNTSKLVDASDALKQESNYVQSAPTKKDEVYSQLETADYRIMTDSDYVILEW